MCMCVWERWTDRDRGRDLRALRDLRERQNFCFNEETLFYINIMQSNLNIYLFKLDYKVVFNISSFQWI